MPRAALRPCAHPTCATLVAKGSCPEHHKPRPSDQYRGTAAQRGYGSRWQKARATYLHKNPLCVECLKEKRVTLATVVDHIIPHRGDQAKFWDSEHNWQSLCARHHNVKTASGQ